METCAVCSVAQLCPTLCDPMEHGLPGFSVHGIFQTRQEYWSGLLFPSLGDLPDPGIELMFPALASGFFMAEPVNSKRLHFQTPSHWELGFSAWTLAGRQSSAYSRDLSSCPLVAQLVKNLPAVQETWVHGLVRIPWRRASQPTPVFLPGECPWTEESCRLQSMRSKRVGHNWVTKHSTYKWYHMVISFSVWFTSLSMIPSTSTHVPASGNFHFVF